MRSTLGAVRALGRVPTAIAVRTGEPLPAIGDAAALRDFVEQGGVHAVLSLNAVRSSDREAAFAQ